VVVLDDLMEADDKRVDVAPGEERKNLVFEYSIADDAIVGLEETQTTRTQAVRQGGRAGGMFHHKACSFCSVRFDRLAKGALRE
jgi:hypothetical protein